MLPILVKATIDPSHSDIISLHADAGSATWFDRRGVWDRTARNWWSDHIRRTGGFGAERGPALSATVRPTYDAPARAGGAVPQDLRPNDRQESLACASRLWFRCCRSSQMSDVAEGARSPQAIRLLRLFRRREADTRWPTTRRVASC